MISQINRECKDVMPKLYAFEVIKDQVSGCYNINILMDIGYCTLFTYGKAVK